MVIIDVEMQKSEAKHSSQAEDKRGVVRKLFNKVSRIFCIPNILFLIVEICILFVLTNSEHLVVTIIFFQISVLFFLHKEVNEGTIILMVSFSFYLGLSLFLFLCKYILIGTFQTLVCLAIKGEI